MAGATRGASRVVSSQRGDGGPIRVLHVDDEPGLAEVTASHLEREDERFEVLAATGVEEGLAWLEADGVDCVVSDYDMPEMDGLAFLETVRERYPDLPFILFTGKGSESVASEAITAGVTDYLQKKPGTEQYQLLANRIRNAVAQVRAQRELGETDRWLELIVDATDTGVWEWNMETDEVVWNDAMERSLGLDPGTFEGTYEAFAMRVHPVELPRLEAALGEAIANDEVFQLAFRKLHADGHVLWTAARGRIIRDREHDRMVGIHHDVTDRKERERAFAEDRDLIDRALQAVDAPFYVVGADGTLDKWNEAFADAVGGDGGALDGSRAVDLFAPGDRDQVADAVETALAGGHAAVEAGLGPDGEEATFEHVMGRVTDDDGEPVCLTCVGWPVGA